VTPPTTAPRTAESALAATAEDHALVSVPAEDRQSGWRLSLSPVSVATGLVVFAIAGYTVVLAGFTIGILVGVGVSVLAVVLGRTLGRMAYETGLSSTVTSRFFGFGFTGSAIGSVIFAFMILGFLAIESALLYQGTLMMLDLDDTWTAKIVIYGLMTLLWIALAVFGLKVALRATGLLIVVTLLVTLWMIVDIYLRGDGSFGDVFGYGGVVPGGAWKRTEAAVGLMGATAGTIALVTTDFARYCRTPRDITILSLAGPITQNIVMTVLGSLVVIGGMPEVVRYLMAHDGRLDAASAAMAGNDYVMQNTGAFFVVFAGWTGFLTIYAAQAKAQAINAYSGSLSLVNLVDSVTRRRPGRVAMVGVGNALALLMICAGILEKFSTYLAYLGAMTLGLCGVMIADYYFVRRGRTDGARGRVERWNWAGVLTLALSAATGMTLMATDVFACGFLVSFALALLLYPALRRLLPEGTGTSYVSEDQAVREAG
jgi:cytosine permease